MIKSLNKIAMILTPSSIPITIATVWASDLVAKAGTIWTLNCGPSVETYSNIILSVVSTIFYKDRPTGVEASVCGHLPIVGQFALLQIAEVIVPL